MSKHSLCFLDKLDTAKEKERKEKLAKQATKYATISFLVINPANNLDLSLFNTFNPF